jgi:hypothetical protein
LRALHDDGLAVLRNRVLHILDWERLTALGSFNPDPLRPQRDQEDLAALGSRAPMMLTPNGPSDDGGQALPSDMTDQSASTGP